jgi:hypothetical protein
VFSICVSLVCVCSLFCLLSVYSTAPEIGCLRPGKKTPCPRVSFPVLALLRISTIRLLRNSEPLSSNAHIWCNVHFGSRCIGSTNHVTIWIVMFTAFILSGLHCMVKIRLSLCRVFT